MAVTFRSAMFTIFNILLGISAIITIGISGYTMYKVEFNIYILIILLISIIMFIVFIFGFFCHKLESIFFIYIIFIVLILIAEIIFALLFLLYNDLNAFIRNNINNLIEVTEEEKDKIIKMILIAICTSILFCFLDFIFAFLYFKKIKDHDNEITKEIDNIKNIVEGGYTKITPDI